MESTHVEAAEESLDDALAAAERPEVRYHVREALQHLVVVHETRADREAERG